MNLEIREYLWSVSPEGGIVRLLHTAYSPFQHEQRNQSPSQRAKGGLHYDPLPSRSGN
jgi:hypothetical protein